MIVTKANEVLALTEAGRVAARALQVAKSLIRAGMTTLELNAIVEETIRRCGLEPAFLTIKGWKHASCISVNDEVVHGIPGDRVLKAGDLVKIDTGAVCDGYMSDTAISIIIPPGCQDSLHILRVTQEALESAIRRIKPGIVLDVSKAIQEGIPKSVGILKGYHGHGVGVSIWEPPTIPNSVIDSKNALYHVSVPPGSVIAVEPMLTLGTGEVVVKPDGWTVATKDGKLAAHFEHTLLITEQGIIILTK